MHGYERLMDQYLHSRCGMLIQPSCKPWSCCLYRLVLGVQKGTAQVHEVKNISIPVTSMSVSGLMFKRSRFAWLFKKRSRRPHRRRLLQMVWEQRQKLTEQRTTPVNAFAFDLNRPLTFFEPRRRLRGPYLTAYPPSEPPVV